MDKIRNVYERACTIHHTKKPNLHLHWAVFEESHGKQLRLYFVTLVGVIMLDNYTFH
jgi:hypothetical protein